MTNSNSLFPFILVFVLVRDHFISNQHSFLKPGIYFIQGRPKFQGLPPLFINQRSTFYKLYIINYIILYLYVSTIWITVLTHQSGQSASSPTSHESPVRSPSHWTQWVLPPVKGGKTRNATPLRTRFSCLGVVFASVSRCKNTSWEEHGRTSKKGKEAQAQDILGS